MEVAIPLCLPDNYSWNPQTHECTKHREIRSHYVVVEEAKHLLEAIQGPVCVVSVAGPLRKGKSYILSQPFAGNREIFPLGHDLQPKTVGIWMWIVPDKYVDTDYNEFTVVLIDSEGMSSTVVDKSDDDTIFTLAVLLSSVLIYNSSGVPQRSDLEELSFVMKLSQRIQVFTGKETTSGQAKLVFPSFIWLLRDLVLEIPKPYKDLKEYFIKQVFPSTKIPGDKAQQVADTILNYFPSFDAFSLPFPSFDPKVVQGITKQCNQSSLNPNFTKEIKHFSKLLKQELHAKKTPDGIEVTGQALSSMLQSYVKTLNTPGAVPSMAGAWEEYIGQEAHELYEIANAVYFNGMSNNLEWNLPCESHIIREQHNKSLKDVMVNVFSVAVGSKRISVEQIKYADEFQAESESIESSWLQRNNELTESNCKTVFEEVKKECLHSVKDTWKTFSNQGDAEMAIRDAYESVIFEFRRRCKGCSEIIENCAYLHKKDLDEAMLHDIGVIRRIGHKKDQKLAHEIQCKEMEDMEESLKAVNIALKEDVDQIDKEMKDLQLQNQSELSQISKEAQMKLKKDREELESIMRNNEEAARRNREEMRQNIHMLERRRDDLQKALEESDKKLNDLRRRRR